MADDIKFVIGVDDDDVLKTIKNTQKLEKEIKDLEKGYKTLSKTQNSGKMSAQAYAQGVSQIDNRIAALNKVLGSGSAAINAHANSLVQSKNKMSKFGMMSQQVGYQVGDFFVQVQSGTSALVAFGQQGTQLAGLLPGVAGAVVGIGLSLGTLLVKGYMDSQKAAEDATKAFEASEEALEEFRSRVEEAEDTVSSFSSVMRRVNSSQTKAAWALLGESTAGQFEASFVESLQSFFGGRGFKAGIAAMFGEDTGFTAAGDAAAVKFATAFGQAVNDMPVGLDTIQEAILGKDVFQLDLIIETLSAFNDVNGAGLAFIETLINIRDEADGYTLVLKDAAFEMREALNAGEDLSNLNLALGIEEARKVAELLAENMNLSLIDAMNLVNLANSVDAGPVGRGRGKTAGAGSTQIERTMLGMGGETIAPYKTRKRRSGGGAKESPQEKLAKYLQGKQQELTLEKQLVGVFDEERKIQSELFKIQNDYKGVITESQAKELEGTLRQIEAERQRQVVLGEVRADQQRLQDTITSSMEDGFMAMIDGTKSVKDAFKEMAAAIIKELLYVMVVKKAVSAVTGFFGFADGGAFSGGSEVKAYADGGVVGGPTTFPMSGGKTGLMGEAGPEAIMPLKRGANGKLGVQMEGGGGDTINVVQNFSFQANGDDSVKKIIAQAAPQIAQMTKSSLLNDRRRGGATKAAFG
jgi:hypothetical protein